MTNYRVTIMHDACTTHDVGSDSEDSAIAAAMEDAGVTLCHHCANKVEFGDPIRAACVENLDSGESNMDADPDYEVVRLRADIERLRGLLSEAGALFRVYEQTHRAKGPGHEGKVERNAEIAVRIEAVLTPSLATSQ